MHQSSIAKEKIEAFAPHYKFDVYYDHDKTLLAGKMQVSLSKKKILDNELLFALPGNRFLSKDYRGNRKHKIVPVFSSRSFRENDEDPKSPKGFSFGEMKIFLVSILTNKPEKKRIILDFKLEHNSNIDIGFSGEKGILRIVFPKKILDLEHIFEELTLEIEFSTKFPENLYNGQYNDVLITSNWYPKLLYWNENLVTKESSWNIKIDAISPANFDVKLKIIQSGTLVSTSGNFNYLAGQTIRLPSLKKKLKSFPLVFFKKNKNLIKREENFIYRNSTLKGVKSYKIISFFLEGQERKGELISNWTKSFINFLQLNYGMILPWENIIIVPVEAEFEQVEIKNNLVFVPYPNYKRSKLMDRQAIGFLTRSLGQLWFGESIWNNQEDQLWLNFGIPAFLGLRYFQSQFGKEAGIFENIDWLNPRYKDHYFEKMVNSIPPKMKYPIISSFKNIPNKQSFLTLVTYKTALVISMLEYLIGEKVFKKGLNSFSEEFKQKSAGLKEFRYSFEKFYKLDSKNKITEELSKYNARGRGSLEWFFSQWFRTVKNLDYSLNVLDTRKLSDGFFEIEIIVERIGSAKMPIEVYLLTEDGNEFRKIAAGIEKEEKVLFITQSLPERVSIDPDEKLMETSRINNHSSNYYRFRFAFDWKKDREHLVLFVPGFGNNAIDGNSLGLGVRYEVENYRIFSIPGYGTKNKRLLYIFNFDRKNFGLHGFEVGFSFYEFGGVQSQGLRAVYEPSKNHNEFGYKFQTSFSREKLFSVGLNSEKDDYSESGETNSFLLDYTGNFSINDFYDINWNLWNEQPALSLSSDFSYVRGQGKLEQVLRLGHRKLIELELIRSSTSGISPIQKKFQLGGPSVLRGYPQNIDLSGDNMLASRLGFKFPLIDTSFWGIISTFKIQGTIFYDQGKIWSEKNTFSSLNFRKSAGIGLEWTVDTVSLFQIPLKFEVAFPVDDKDYKKPQFIFLGVLTGS